MAYFIVIGTDNNVQSVVDEITNTHLQHNVVTSGCIHEKDGNLFYQWTLYNQKGENKSSDNGQKKDLDKLLTNQIAQFRTLLPNGQAVQVFVVSLCLSQEQCEALEFVCDNLYRIGGTQLANVSVDLVLLGYDPSKSDDVTIRPNWRNIKSVLGIGSNSAFYTNILYLNNMDYKGRATNIDTKLLARFLCLWSKMVSSGDSQPKIGISHTYSIGLAEYQYNFEDLAEFFKLSAEERILDRTLNASPSSATENLCKSGLYKYIDLQLPWLDGLLQIKERWDSYCNTEYDYSRPSQDQGHTLQSQKKILAEYLNAFLRIYVNQCKQDIIGKTTGIRSLQEKLNKNKEVLLQEQSEASEEGHERLEDEISKLNNSIKDIELEIENLEEKIKRNSFSDTYDIYNKCNPDNILTIDDRNKYEEARKSEETLIDYLYNSRAEAVKYVREAIKILTEEAQFPEYPGHIVNSIGMLKQIEQTDKDKVEEPIGGNDQLSERSGCFLGVIKWLRGLFVKDRKGSEDTISYSASGNTPPLIELKKTENDNITSAFKALDQIKDVEDWWLQFTQMINTKQERLKECGQLMDEYKLPDNPKSHTLIDMDLVRLFRDNNGYYQEMLMRLEERWFDSTVEPTDRQTLQELIKHQVIDAIRGQYHTLKWDNTHPFVKEEMSDTDVSDIISATTKQADFFAEYIKLDSDAIGNKIRTLFYFNDLRMDCSPIDFRKKYEVADNSLTPCYLQDFVNSLCAVKVIDISEPVNELKDFKPDREYQYKIKPKRSYHRNAQDIIEGAKSSKDKIRKIYDWLCDNIKYDTTKTIYSADTAWEQKRGVCQAYCELFCVLGESVGLTIEIICGKSKNSDGKVSDSGHSWIYAFTEGYDGILIDPTWGAGGIDEGGKYHKGSGEEREMWFDIDPARMIYTHYPEHDYWQLQTPKISEEQFSNLPVKYPSNRIDATEELAQDLLKIDNQQ